jgi:hypothetical protein
MTNTAAGKKRMIWKSSLKMILQLKAAFVNATCIPKEHQKITTGKSIDYNNLWKDVQRALKGMVDLM